MALIVLCSIWALHRYHTPCLADATSAAASQGPGALCVIDPVQSRAVQLRINLMASLMVVFSLWGMLRMVRRQQLALEVVAEGVETPEQLVYLRLAGCDQVQGYHFSRPLQAEQIAEFERRFRSRTRLTA